MPFVNSTMQIKLTLTAITLLKQNHIKINVGYKIKMSVL